MKEWSCSLPDFPEDKHKPGSTPAFYMGRLRVIQGEDFFGHNPNKPCEPHTEGGCPGGWYRCAFVGSLMRYERVQSSSGFSSNILLDRTDDSLIIEATQYLENQRMRYHNYSMETRYNGSK